MRRDWLKEKSERLLNKTLNRNLTGKLIGIETEETDITNPFNPSTRSKIYDVVALVSRDENRYQGNYDSSKEYLMCKIFKSDIEELIKEGANLSVGSLKKDKRRIKIDRGSLFSITSESFEGFNGNLLVLGIERDL